MTARRWSARATPANAARYRRYFEATLTPHLRQLSGFLGATVMERPAGELVDILVITWWESMAAIRAFAGGDVGAAVISDEAQPLLADADARVEHYEVTVDAS
jgi:heme-degrading monooxygenase HmoA